MKAEGGWKRPFGDPIDLTDEIEPLLLRSQFLKFCPFHSRANPEPRYSGEQAMIRRQTLPHWIIALTMVAMVVMPQCLDALALSGIIAVIATAWACYE